MWLTSITTFINYLVSRQTHRQMYRAITIPATTEVCTSQDSRRQDHHQDSVKQDKDQDQDLDCAWLDNMLTVIWVIGLKSHTLCQQHLSLRWGMQWVLTIFFCSYIISCAILWRKVNDLMYHCCLSLVLSAAVHVLIFNPCYVVNQVINFLLRLHVCLTTWTDQHIIALSGVSPSV